MSFLASGAVESAPYYYPWEMVGNLVLAPVAQVPFLGPGCHHL
jgi:hypothetical protein